MCQYVLLIIMYSYSFSHTQRAFEIEGLFLLNAALFFELKNGFVNGVSASMAIYGDGKNW